MIRHVFSLILVVLLLSVSSACKTVQPVGNEVPDTVLVKEDGRLANSLLWEISGNGLPEASYLFGTIHLIDRESYFFNYAAENALAKADRVTFEINMEDMSDFSQLFSLLTEAFMKDGVTLKDLLSSEEYATVKSFFEEKGLPMMMLDRIKPMFLTIFTSSDVDLGDMQSGELTSYEMEIFSKAKDQDKEVAGLETIAYQLSLFDSIPYKVQAKMLVESIEINDSDSDQFEKMIALYKSQDIESMHEMIGEEGSGVEGYEYLLVVNRNNNWINPMISSMKEKSTFFAVGAGHLGGPEGVIRLLRKEGYVVKPILDQEPLLKKI